MTNKLILQTILCQVSLGFKHEPANSVFIHGTTTSLQILITFGHKLPILFDNKKNTELGRVSTNYLRSKDYR
jgi:hypothetical protein